MNSFIGGGSIWPGAGRRGLRPHLELLVAENRLPAVGFLASMPYRTLIANFGEPRHG